MHQPLDGGDEQDSGVPVNSLPPVVPDEPDEVNSLPPVVADEPEPDEVNSLPPVVPDEPEPDEVNSLPPVVPEGEENSLPPVVPDEPEPLPRDVRVFVAPGDERVDERSDEPEPSEPADERAPGEPEPSEPADEPEPDGPADSTPAPPPAEPPSGWAVLGRALKPRATQAQILAGVLCALLGFALVAQVRQSGETNLAGMRQGDLVRILDETTNRGDALAREAADLARERDDLLSGSDRRQAALDALRRSAETQGILAGRLPAEGSGVIVTLTDADGFIKPFTMLNMLEELRNAGAEAIELNGQRVTASSAFTGSGGAVVLDGVELSTPYRWIAIGDPDIIAPALQIPGGAMAQVRNDGGKGSVDRADLVEVKAVRVVPDPVYATPVPPQGD